MEPPHNLSRDVDVASNDAFGSIARRGVAQLTLHEHARCLVVEREVIKLSPTEYRLVSILVAHLGELVLYEVLTQAAFGATDGSVSRAALFKHLDRIRTKLRMVGLDLPGVTNYGCILTWEVMHPTDAPTA
ncbi:MAG TPA: helix-turn-helix domain-containing protein [Ktedonobacterales bacterium]|nr:helix-turn-helix domain-containing protein [Ktedonobacterales bacterium]